MGASRAAAGPFSCQLWRLHAILVSWFRSSHHLDIGLRANFETETTLGINTLLVSFDTEIRQEHDIEMVRISESGHLAQDASQHRQIR